MEKFRKWFDNYWYHYKWQTLIAILFIVTFAIGFGQIAFEKNSYDVYAIYAGGVYLEDEHHLQIEAAIKDAAVKVSGESDRDVNLQMLIYLSDEKVEELRKLYEEAGDEFQFNPIENAQVLDTYMKQLVSGENVIMFVDPYLYDLAEENNALYPIKDILGREFPGTTESGLGLKLSECGLLEKYPSLKNLPENTVVCFRKVTHAMQLIGRSDSQNSHQFQLDVARELFSGVGG